jgi:hypothetical protein
MAQEGLLLKVLVAPAVAGVLLPVLGVAALFMAVAVAEKAPVVAAQSVLSVPALHVNSHPQT